MSTKRPGLSQTRPIVNQDGTLMQEAASFFGEVNKCPVLIGSGSPESVVSAEVGQLYMNSAGTAGSILYVKRDAAVSGDDTQGWILV